MSKSPYEICRAAMRDIFRDARLAIDELDDESDTIEHLEEDVIALVKSVRALRNKLKKLRMKSLKDELSDLDSKLAEFDWVWGGDE